MLIGQQQSKRWQVKDEVCGRWRTIGVLTKGVQGVQYSGFSSALGRRSRYSGLSSVRARVNVPLGEDRRNGIRITAARVRVVQSCS